MDKIVEMTLSQAVNVTDTNYIRKYVRARIKAEGLNSPPVERVHFNVFILCTRGSGTHMVDFEELDMNAGTAVWVRPGQVQRWSDTSDQFDASVVVFDSKVIPDLPLFDHLVASPRPIDMDTDTSLLKQQIEWLATDLEANQDHALAAAVVSVALRLFARHALQRHPTDNADSGRRHLAESFVVSVEQNIGQRTVAWHAKQIGASTRTIARATVDALGQRPKEVIDSRVMLEARRQLAWSDDDIGTVARRLRFSDKSNFTKFFRLHTGTSPSDFRENVQNPSAE